ncbi:MAG: alpha-amylase family glycosyl hydrolase [Elusimicrobiota bacterium]
MDVSIFRKSLAVALSASLMLAQQGFVWEAVAGVVVAPRAGSAAAGTGAAAGGAATAVSQVSLSNLSVNTPAGLTGSSLLIPAAAPKVGVQAPRIGVRASAATPGPAPAQSALSRGEPARAAAPTVGARGEGASPLEANLSAASKKAAPAAANAPKSDGLIGRLAAFGRTLVGAPAAAPVSLRRIFDGSATRSGLTAPADAAAEADGSRKRRIGLSKPDAGTAASASANEEPYQRVKELRQVLGDGTVGAKGRIEAFSFGTPDGGRIRARSAGMEGFLYSKLEHERAHGQAFALAQLDDYFGYLDGLLAPVGWTQDIRRELGAIRRSPVGPEEKNGRLNEFLQRTVARLQSDIKTSDPALWGRDASIYMILARAYNRIKADGRGGKKNFFDSLDDAELDGIRERTGANTVWILDMFEIGDIARWGTGGGSPYAIKGYRVKEELGGDEGLKRFVDRAHAKGLKVMTDYIPNHTSLDSHMVAERPEGFIHIVPPQPEPNEPIEDYKKRIISQVPHIPAPGGGPMYYLLETDNYPEGGKRVHKFILLHHPYQDGGWMWVDMGQIDYTHPAAWDFRIKEARGLFERFGIDGVRRDMSYLVLSDKFHRHWAGTLAWERDNATGWVREQLERAAAGLERRHKALAGREYLDTMMAAVREVKPGAFHIDEAYEEYEALSRSGSHARYNKMGLYDALVSRDAGWIREALKELSFRTWQKGGAGLVNFVGTHDGGEGNPVDKLGRHFRAAVAMALLARPTLFYNGLELGVGQAAMLISDDLHKSQDLAKAIPFDIKVLINWANADPGNVEFLRRILKFGERHSDLFRDGGMEVLSPHEATPVVAYTAARDDAGGRKTVLVAANFGDEAAWGHFNLGRAPVLEKFGAFRPRAGKTYVLRDRAHPAADGSPAAYVRTGKELLEKGLFVRLDPGDVHLFEIEELDPNAPARAPPSAGAKSGALSSGLWRAQGASGRELPSLTGSSQGTPVSAAATSVQDPDPLKKVRVFLTRPGERPIAADLASLGRVLAADRSLAETLNRIGRIRVVLSKENPNGGLSKEDIARVEETLRSYGIRAKLQVESIPVDWKKHSRKGAPAADEAVETGARRDKGWKEGRFWRYFLGPVTRPFRELAYLARTFANSLTRPTLPEVAGGIASKAFSFTIAVGVWTSMYAGHPAAAAIAIGLSLSLDTFHGIWINSWSNFQNNIGKQRGLRYQTVFNFAYGQWWGGVFRTLAWSVLPGKVPPWSPLYWKDVGIATVIGTFFGTLGYRGLNALYDNGRISRWQRSAIQQLRDLFFVLAGTYFGAGSMALFWTVFAAQQTLDLVIFLISRAAKKRPILYVTDEAVAGTGEFQGMYPVSPESASSESPLKQALGGIANSPFVKPVALFVRWLRGKLSKNGR